MKYNTSPSPETRDLASAISGAWVREFPGYDDESQDAFNFYNIEIVLDKPGDTVAFDDFTKPLMGSVLFSTMRGTYITDGEQIAFLGKANKAGEFKDSNKSSTQFGDGQYKLRFDPLTVGQTPSFLKSTFKDEGNITYIELAGEIFGDTSITGDHDPRAIGRGCQRDEAVSPFHAANKIFAPIVEKYQLRNEAAPNIAARVVLN